jgi:hypothetical protein
VQWIVCVPAHPRCKRLVLNQQRRVGPARRKATGLHLGETSNRQTASPSSPEADGAATTSVARCLHASVGAAGTAPTSRSSTHSTSGESSGSIDARADDLPAPLAP